MLPAILTGGALGGALGMGTGKLTGKALGKYPGQSRDEGARAGAITGALLNAYGDYKGKPPKIFDAADEASRLRNALKTVNPSLGEKAVQWGKYVGRLGKRFAPELAAGALGAAILARKKPKKKKEKTAVSKKYELKNSPGRSSVKKQLQMLERVHQGGVQNLTKKANMPASPTSPPDLVNKGPGRPPKPRKTQTPAQTFADEKLRLTPVTTKVARWYA